jgi:hypothetical protein
MKSKAAKNRRPTKKTAKRKSVPALVVRDYDWGSLYSGTKEAIIKSGLISARDFPKNTKLLDQWRGEDLDGVYDLAISRDRDGTWRVWVSYHRGINTPRAILEDARNKLSVFYLEASKAIMDLVPPPPSFKLGIKARYEQKAEVGHEV